jgi:hypothetical protein
VSWGAIVTTDAAHVDETNPPNSHDGDGGPTIFRMLEVLCRRKAKHKASVGMRTARAVARCIADSMVSLWSEIRFLLNTLDVRGLW